MCFELKSPNLSGGAKRFISLPFVGLIAWLFFSLINYDQTKNVDFDNYKANYENEWGQFEIGFEILIRVARAFNLEFIDFWTSIILLEVFLIVLFYGKLWTLLVAAPNIFYLSHGVLGTQVRFGLAALIFLNFIKYFHGGKKIYILLPQSMFMHFSMIVGVYFVFFAKKLNFYSFGGVLRENLFKMIFFVATLWVMYIALEVALNSLGYSYYLESKYLASKSLLSTIYIFLSVLVCGFMLCDSSIIARYGWVLYFAFMNLLFCVVFLGAAIVSGRYLGVYFLLEPFVLCAYLERYGLRKSFFPVLIVMVLLYFSKLISFP